MIDFGLNVIGFLKKNVLFFPSTLVLIEEVNYYFVFC